MKRLTLAEHLAERRAAMTKPRRDTIDAQLRRIEALLHEIITKLEKAK